MGLRRAFAIACGRIAVDRGFLLGGERRVAKVVAPVGVFLLEHDRGLVLVDTGMHLKCMTDPIGYWGRSVRHSTFFYTEGQDPPSRLREIGYAPDVISHVLLTHLHNDHAGCVTLFPSATFYAQAAEWSYAVSMMHQENNAYIADDFHHPLNYQLLDGETFDLFGDGSIVALRSIGHTPGHQSVLLRLPESGPLLIVGDAANAQESWDMERPPGIVWDGAVAVATVRSLRGLVAAEGARVFIGHDPDHWTARPTGGGADFVVVP